MSLTSPSVSSFTISLSGVEKALPQLAKTLKLSLPINISNLSFLKVYAGTFTPANNTLIAVPSADIPSNSDDTLILVIADGQINLSISAPLETPYAPMKMVGILTFKGDASNQPGAVTIDGRTSVPDPMAQGTALNYTIVFMKGTLS